MFIGRKHELDLIRNSLADRSKAQLVLIYGRRRVGKSTLIREALRREKRVLYFEGIEGAPTRAQIDQFLDDLARQTGRVRLGARNWREVFQGLSEILSSGRWVLVFDEFPWMGAGRTRIVSELKLYWDRWVCNRNLALILCGSVASFMTRHVVHSKAFHNRKTLEMCLGPLRPHEVSQFIPRRSIREKAQLYMCLGGVPKYLEQINPRVSLEQNLNRLCFTSGGFFVDEFETLFKEQFRSIRTYESLVATLAQAPASLSELSRRLETTRGGGLQEQVRNLVRAQFVREYRPLSIGDRHRTRTVLYKLADPFLIFYFRYLHKNRTLIRRNRGENLFRAIAGPTIQQYYGYAFERLAEDAVDTILGHLGLALADVESMGPWFQQPGRARRGAQIDWLIVRRDGIWTPIEFKYSTTKAGMDVVHEMEERIARLDVPDPVSIEPVLITANGTTSAVARLGFFTSILTLSDLV